MIPLLYRVYLIPTCTLVAVFNSETDAKAYAKALETKSVVVKGELVAQYAGAVTHNA